MRIYSGRGAAIWLSERKDGGLIVQAGHSKLLLSADELQQFVDGIATMTGTVASTAKVPATQ